MAAMTPMDLDPLPAPKVLYDDSWETHKPQLYRLYMEENLKLTKIREIMFEEHLFRAETHQYKYRFRTKWGWEKNLTSTRKARMLDIGQKRAARGEATAIQRQGRKLESKQLLRFAREQKADIRLFSASANIQLPDFMSGSLLNQQIGFAGWNVPYQYILQKLARHSIHGITFTATSSPLSGSDICTPPGHDAMSPGLAQAISIRAANANTERLLLGDLGGLMKCLDESNLKNLAEWMNQYWYLCYMTAKNWGSRPNTWTSLDLAPYTRLLENLPKSPRDAFSDESASPSSASHAKASLTSLLHGAMKGKLCKWTIHVRSDLWVYLPDSAPSAEQNATPEDAQHPTYEQRLHEAMRSNDFSAVTEEDLPLSLKRMSEIVAKSPTQIFQESVKFAIISRNIELLDEMLSRRDLGEHNMNAIAPLHLALTYLDGSRSCCAIFRMLLHASKTMKISLRAPGPSGLSLFDCIMIHILRNHTTMPPGVVNGDTLGEKTYGGEEVDACGRWDPASDVYRLLSQTGLPIPPSWRHKFCYTSIQSICHCLLALGDWGAFTSGSLFLRRCFHCGLKMALPPIHILVLTAWHVLILGTHDEDLFGMICVLLCVATSDPPRRLSELSELPFRSAQVAPANFTSEPPVEQDNCEHESLWPSELARKLMTLSLQDLQPRAMHGWSVFCRILEQIEGQYRWVSLGVVPANYTLAARDGADEDERLLFVFFEETTEDVSWKGYDFSWCGHFDVDQGLSFGRDNLLGHLWAAIQADILSHRRRQVGDAWTSEHLSITVIEAFLNSQDPTLLPVVSLGGLSRYCVCGKYDGDVYIPRREQLCGEHLGNLDDGNMAAYVDDCMLYG